jgi:hypothetical protein
MNDRKSPQTILRSLFTRKPQDTNNLSLSLIGDDQQCDALRAEIEKEKLALAELKTKINAVMKRIKKLQTGIDDSQASKDLNEINYMSFPDNEEYKNNSLIAAQRHGEYQLTQDEEKAELEKLRGEYIAIEGRLNLLELNLKEGIPTININALTNS